MPMVDNARLFTLVRDNDPVNLAKAFEEFKKFDSAESFNEYYNTGEDHDLRAAVGIGPYDRGRDESVLNITDDGPPTFNEIKQAAARRFAELETHRLANEIEAKQIEIEAFLRDNSEDTLNALTKHTDITQKKAEADALFGALRKLQAEFQAQVRVADAGGYEGDVWGDWHDDAIADEVEPDLDEGLEEFNQNIKNAHNLQDLREEIDKIEAVLHTTDKHLGFTDEVRDNDENINEGIEGQATRGLSVSELQQAGSQEVKFKGQVLEEGQIIRSSKNYGQNKFGILKQTSTGKVTDMSTPNLSDEQKTEVAIKQVQMLLANFDPAKGKIILRGHDKEMGKKVYAGLLLAAQAGLIEQDVIDVRMDDVKPSRGLFSLTADKRDTKFIEKHLGKVGKKDAEDTFSMAKQTRDEFRTKLQEAKDEAKPHAERATNRGDVEAQKEAVKGEAEKEFTTKFRP